MVAGRAAAVTAAADVREAGMSGREQDGARDGSVVMGSARGGGGKAKEGAAGA